MADTAPAMSLDAGDRVVYPNQGVCRVTGIEEKEVAGQKLVFVSMQREEDGARLYVPRPKLMSIGVRKVSTTEQVDQMFAFLKADTERADLDWKQRARTNLDRMTTGGLLGLAEVVKGLQVLSELRPLPTKERELYDNARHLLVAEVSVSLGIEEKSAEDAVDVALFPPGKERPKRTAEEFKRRGEDDLDLGDDLLGLAGDLDLPPDEDAEEKPEDEQGEAEGDDEAAGDAAPKGARAARKPARVALSDDEVTLPMGTALVPDEALPPKRKRGRPPKPKPEPEVAAAPKKRGRPPKPKPEGAPPAEPKKRGRPPKAKTDEPAAKKKK
jgi:CarD family transcriptional regulator